MTTTIGTQFRPYIEEETSTKDAVPCGLQHYDFVNESPNKQGFMGPTPVPCKNAATHDYICTLCGFDVPVCTNCMKQNCSDPVAPIDPAIHGHAGGWCKHGSVNGVYIPR
jgi:hypothetical protein